jgi:hypothetical protein
VSAHRIFIDVVQHRPEERRSFRVSCLPKAVCQLVLQKSGRRRKSCSDGMDSGYRRLAGKVFEGEQSPKAAGERFGFRGEGFLEGQDSGVWRGRCICRRHFPSLQSTELCVMWCMNVLPASRYFLLPRDNDFAITFGPQNRAVPGAPRHQANRS